MAADPRDNTDRKKMVASLPLGTWKNESSAWRHEWPQMKWTFQTVSSQGKTSCLCSFIKSCIIHTPKKLSNERAGFKKTIQSLQAKSSVARGASDLKRTYLIFTAKRRWVSRVPFPHFSIISSASQRDIVLGDKWERSARAQTVRGRSPPSHDPERCRLVLPDNHNCVLKPLITFRSLEWYCFAMNPYEKCTALGDYGSCGGAEGGS